MIGWGDLDQTSRGSPSTAARSVLSAPFTPPASSTVPDPQANDYRLQPSINIVRHEHRFLALSECSVPYEVAPDLDTIGRCDFAGGLPLGMCAHPKVDPATGEMIVFRYWSEGRSPGRREPGGHA
jgi:carotenoid cleavage dioxygenase-like enzyme